VADDGWRRLGDPRDVYVRPEEDIRIDVAARQALLVLSGTVYDELLRCATSLRPVGNATNSRLCFATDGSRLLVHFPLYGSPRMASALEQLASIGVREIVSVGLCGSLSPTVPIGCVVAPSAAVRTDAVSLHYAPECYPAVPSHTLSAALLARLDAVRVVLQMSTDALYRETFDAIEHWRRLGVQTIDMEAATQFVVGRVLGLETAWLGVVSDLLVDRHHHGAVGGHDVVATAVRVCMDLLDGWTMLWPVEPIVSNSGSVKAPKPADDPEG
jgi:uridine phosphorylase